MPDLFLCKQFIIAQNIDFSTAGDVTILLVMPQPCAGCGYHDNDNAGALHKAFLKGQLLFTGVSPPPPVFKSRFASVVAPYYHIGLYLG